jgi:GntR family transcriptional regulator, transcriptional repressor for pyruvate dehydrogenase complex
MPRSRKDARPSPQPPEEDDDRRRPLASGERSCIPVEPSGGLTRPLKTSERVARDVVHDIIVGQLRPGDRLTSEAAMLEHYGVSRESLREGLRLLEVQGLISLRRGPGGGPVVGTVDPAHLGRVTTLYFHMAGATYRELFEAWQLAEATLAEWAARNRDGALRAAVMKPYMVDEATPDERTIEEFAESHAGFHGALASLVENKVLEISLQTLGQIVTHHSAVTRDPRELRDMIEHDHHELAQAIAAGHPRRARGRMEQHIAGISREHFAGLGGQLDDFIEWR